MTWDDEDDAPTRHSHSHSSVDRIPFFPVLLIAFGAAALLHQIVGRGVSVIPLAIGIYLIARSRASAGGHYPLLVIGAVLTGSGAGNLLGDILNTGISDALGTLGTAAGFFWLFTTDRQRSSWAIIPAAIIGLIGVGRLGFQLTDVMRGGSGGWLLPAGVVVAGILLLGAHRLPGPLRLAGLVFVGAAALSLVTNSNDTPRRRPLTVTTGPVGNSITLPEIGPRTLKFTGSSADITVERGDTASAKGVKLRVTESGNEVVVLTDRADEDVTFTVPEGTKLQLQTSSGDIQVDAATSSAVLTSSSGDVDLTIAGDPDVTVATSSGDIEAAGFDASDMHGDRSFVHDGDSGRVVVTTSSGDVQLARSAPR